MKARNKNTGAEIVAELLDLTGAARKGVSCFHRDEHGRLGWQTDEHTEVEVIEFREIENATAAGECVLIDADGAYVAEADVELVDDEDPTVKRIDRLMNEIPWDNPSRVRQILRESPEKLRAMEVALLDA